MSDKVYAYWESVSEKLRKVSSIINESFHCKNNLSINKCVVITDLCKVEHEKKTKNSYI